jgi:excisionase family DNA binding protein
MATTIQSLPHLRFEIPEAARILRISRATLYERIGAGLISVHKDGRRTFITICELERYVKGLAAGMSEIDVEESATPSPVLDQRASPAAIRSISNRR